MLLIHMRESVFALGLTSLLASGTTLLNTSQALAHGGGHCGGGGHSSFHSSGHCCGHSSFSHSSGHLSCANHASFHFSHHSHMASNSTNSALLTSTNNSNFGDFTTGTPHTTTALSSSQSALSAETPVATSVTPVPVTDPDGVLATEKHGLFHHLHHMFGGL